MPDPVRPDPALDPERCPDPSVSVSAQRTPGRLRARLQGDLDLATADHLRALLEPLVAEAPDRLVLDLRDVRFVDVIGLRALLEVTRAQGADGRQVVVAEPSTMLRRMVALLDLQDVLTFGDADETSADQTGADQTRAD